MFDLIRNFQTFYKPVGTLPLAKYENSSIWYCQMSLLFLPLGIKRLLGTTGSLGFCLWSIFSLRLFSICIYSSVKSWLESFTHSLESCLPFYSWSTRVPFYILDVGSLPDMCLIKNFSQSVACLLNYLMECLVFLYFLNMQVVLHDSSISIWYNNFLLSTF